MDKATHKVISDAEHLQQLAGHPGWKIARMKLITTIKDLESIRNLNPTDGDVATELKARQTAVTYLFDWLKDVEGTVDKNKDNAALMEEVDKEYIKQY